MSSSSDLQPEKYSMVLGRIVAEFRAEIGITQAVMAQRVGMDRSLLARIEVGRNTATIDHLFMIERLLITDGLLAEHGNLMILVDQATKRLDARPAVDPNTTSPGRGPSHSEAAIKRIAAGVVNGWLQKRNETKRTRRT